MKKLAVLAGAAWALVAGLDDAVAREEIPEGAAILRASAPKRWGAEVRRELHRAWAIPEVIPDAILRTLAMTVIVQIDERGNIKSWKPRSSSQNALFNSSVKLVFNRVRSLPAPPAGALEMFKGGWLALRFTKEEAEQSR